MRELEQSSAVERPREAGVRLIILYKLIKGAAQVTLAATLFVLLLLHATGPLESMGVHLQSHFAGAWSVELAKLLMSAAEPRHLEFIALALTLDAGLTLLEGWALYHAHWWGPWLVVVATSSLLPFEAAALVRKVHAGRLIVFLLNVVIVVYLARTAARHARRARAG